MSKLLEQVNCPADLKKLSLDELNLYANEVREFIIKSVEKNGGHLASNLGAVDFTIALHYVYDSPNDKIIFDVSHQSYTHKIITGRRAGFENLRHDGGISGFTNTTESEYDCCTMGHSSTALSIGLGFARACAINNENYKVVSVIGDGALTGGVAFEALNDIGASNVPMVVLLNDNKMSISQNVGGLSKYLAKLRLSKKYVAFKQEIKKGLVAIPFVGKTLAKFIETIKDTLKSWIVGNSFFENIGFKYYGPFDGHDIALLVNILEKAKERNKPAIIHVITQKGKGYDEAVKNPTKYHGLPSKSNLENTFSQVLSNKLLEKAEENKNFAVITAAMASGTGVDKFMEKYPLRTFDVGIAEQHAVSLSSGLSRGSVLPVFAVYSTFLQRAYDQIMTDICIDNLPAIFTIDHAGFVEGDGVTHQGVYDISYLSSLPNLEILAPKDGVEYSQMLDYAFDCKKPIAIRYPKSFTANYQSKSIFNKKWELLKNDGDTVILACSAKMVELASKIEGVTVVNARVIKPLDFDLIDSILNKNIITLEDGVINGGFGQMVASYILSKGYSKKIVNLGYGDNFITSLNADTTFIQNGLTIKNIEKIIKDFE